MYTKILRKIVAISKIVSSGHCSEKIGDSGDSGGSGHCD